MTAAPLPDIPSPDCDLCPRLAAFRAANRDKYPHFHNAPVPSFGSAQARLLIVGLAPGLKGANATGRPFTGDYAGDLLYDTLGRHGFAQGHYDRHSDDGLVLQNCRLTNAVRCVPPQNRPIGAETTACRRFLSAEIATMTQLKAIFCLGRVSHDAVLRCLGRRLAEHPFAHGAVHDLGDGRRLFDSYHCSRYNTQTGRLTPAMFDQVVRSLRDFLRSC